MEKSPLVLALCSSLMALAKNVSVEVVELECYRMLRKKLRYEGQLDGGNSMGQRTGGP